MTKRIPISDAKRIAEKYGYQQVVIIARSPGKEEWCTTYGTSKVHCVIAAKIGDTLQKLNNGELKLVRVEDES